MKAQSELAGDRKRRAETARPRLDGVTSWIPGAVDMSKSREVRASTMLAAGDAITISPAITSAIDRICATKLKRTEVSNRPAGQQCPVCTP